MPSVFIYDYLFVLQSPRQVHNSVYLVTDDVEISQEGRVVDTLGQFTHFGSKLFHRRFGPLQRSLLVTLVVCGQMNTTSFSVTNHSMINIFLNFVREFSCDVMVLQMQLKSAVLNITIPKTVDL